MTFHIRSITVSLLIVSICLCPVAFSEAGITVNVRDTGAIGNGKADDTQAFIKAVSLAKASRQLVVVPAGRYVISRPIDLENISLSGLTGGAWPSDMEALPVLVPTHRNGPAFRLGAGGAIHWVDIDYQWDKEPSVGPPAILITGTGALISNIRIRYAWDGIITDGVNNVGRANLENIFMVAIRNVGVRMTGTWDVARIFRAGELDFF